MNDFNVNNKNWMNIKNYFNKIKTKKKNIYIYIYIVLLNSNAIKKRNY